MISLRRIVDLKVEFGNYMEITEHVLENRFRFLYDPLFLSKYVNI